MDGVYYLYESLAHKGHMVGINRSTSLTSPTSGPYPTVQAAWAAVARFRVTAGKEVTCAR